MLDMPGTSAHALEAGWSELRAGRWAPARELFEQAVASDEAPEALEGLSWAAWWLDDSDAVFDARERAYRLYKASGDRGSAARMATWLAADQLDFRGACGGSEWMAAARPPPAGSTRAGTRSRLAGLSRGIRRLHPRRCRRRRVSSAVRAAELGQRFEVTDLEMLGLALHGSTLWRPRLRWRRACSTSTKPLPRLSKATPRSPSRAPGHAVFSSPRARPCSTTTAQPSGAIGSPTSQIATEAATCSRSAGPSTAQCTSGGAAGRTRRRCSSRRSRTTPARARHGSGHRWSCSRT